VNYSKIRKMKIIITILIALSTINPTCKGDFTIIGTTSQQWHGGRSETGYGTYYKIELIPHFNSDRIKFKGIWIGDKFHEVKAFEIGKKDKPEYFGVGSNVLISVNDKVTPKSKSSNKSISKEEHENSKKDEISRPTKYKSEILLSYILKGKHKYFEIEKVKVKVIKALYYP